MKNKTIYNCEISDYIKPLDLKRLIRLANSENTNILIFKDNMIVFYYLNQIKHINANGDLIMWDYISEIYYSKVPEYHRFVFFDDIFDIFEYVDDISQISCKGESSKIISIFQIPDKIIDSIYSKIIEKEKKMI